MTDAPGLRRRRFLAGGAALFASGPAMARQATGPTLEPILDPGLPIVDPHHHLWPASAKRALSPGRYMLQDLLEDLGDGHNIVQTVFVECHSMYRASGPEALKSLGETEFVNGVAAMSASGDFGPARVAAGIVGNVDLALGAAAEGVLQAHAAAAGGRFRGVRYISDWDAYPLFGFPFDPKMRFILEDPKVEEGIGLLGRMGLSLDAWCFHPQLGQLAAMARRQPDTIVILNHLGSPLGQGPYAGKGAEVFSAWKAGMAELARCDNVRVKLGGLGMAITGSSLFDRRPPGTTAELAREWRPYVETTIGLFGADRCMFESNFPVDRDTAAYRTLWNVFKTIAAGYSATERTALFSGSARRAYGLPEA